MGHVAELDAADLRAVRDEAGAGGSGDHGRLDLRFRQVDVGHARLGVDAVAADQGNVGVHAAEHLVGERCDQGVLQRPERAARDDHLEARYRRLEQQGDRQAAGDDGQFPQPPAAASVRALPPAAATAASSKGRSLSRPASNGISPPRMRRTPPSASSASRSWRTVTAETPNSPLSSATLAKARFSMMARMRSLRSPVLKPGPGCWVALVTTSSSRRSPCLVKSKGDLLAIAKVPTLPT